MNKLKIPKIIPIIRRSFPQTIAKDIVDVQTMSGPFPKRDAREKRIANIKKEIKIAAIVDADKKTVKNIKRKLKYHEKKLKTVSGFESGFVYSPYIPLQVSGKDGKLTDMKPYRKIKLTNIDGL